MQPMIVRGTPAELSEQAAAILIDEARSCLDKNGRAVIGLVGGRSVAPIYRLFGEASPPWQHIHLLLLDERLVPSDHPDSNYKLAADALGAQARLRLRPFCSTAVKPQEDLQRYNEFLATIGGKLDIVLVSSGEDGHIASLFPGHGALGERCRDFMLISDAPKPPQSRMSAGSALIRQAKTGLILFLGQTKQVALTRFLAPESTENDCPAKIITSLNTSYLFTDLL